MSERREEEDCEEGNSIIVYKEKLMRSQELEPRRPKDFKIIVTPCAA